MNPLLQRALAAHQRGQIAEAERLYGQALSLEPANPVTQHFFGLFRYQQGRLAEAEALIGTALKQQPSAPNVLAHYGVVLQALGRPAEALEQFDRAVARDPGYGEAWNNRGGVLAQMGRFAEAIASFDRVLAINPRAMDALLNRAVALCYLGRLPDAVASYDRALAIQPNDPDALAARAGVLSELGRLEEALAGYDKVLSLGPPQPEWLHHRGVVLVKLARGHEGLACIDRALALAPGHARAWGDRAGMLQTLGRSDEALASVDRALALTPGDVGSLHNRGLILRSLRRSEEALASYDRALALEPGYAEAWNDRGIALHWDFRRSAEAVDSFDHCLALKPDHAGALNNLGAVLWDLGRIDEAVFSFDKALAFDPSLTNVRSNRGSMIWSRKRLFEPAIADLETVLRLEPDYPFVRGDLFHIKAYAADWREFDEQKALIDRGVQAGRPVVVPFAYQAVSASPADLQACARIYALDKHPAAPAVFTRTDRRPGPIRLGYVCGEFREQATMHLTAGLYEAHDRSRFEVMAFDNGRNDGSAMRARVERAFDLMIDISALGDPDAARCVTARDVDILINLNGYYGAPRMDLFARRPAPVQVNFLGFPGTLGAPYMDYAIADLTVIPLDERRFYDEQVVYLPGSYQVNDDRRPTPQPARNRAEHGLPEGAFVFCHFNVSYKLTPQTFDAWMRILQQVKGSVLWLLQGEGPFADNLRREAAAAGVQPERLVFAPMLNHQDHLARLPLGDLFLDSLPYNAHTTASDALWMGLPLLTCRGQAFPGRVAASLLAAVGLPELIAENIAAYEALAVALAQDKGRLGSIRAKLAAARPTAPLFDTARFARHIETAYETMLGRWARGEAPEGFSVED